MVIAGTNDWDYGSVSHYHHVGFRLLGLGFIFFGGILSVEGEATVDVALLHDSLLLKPLSFKLLNPTWRVRGTE